MSTNPSELWAKIAIDLLSNPKVRELEAAAKWLYVASILIARRDLTDGFVRAPVVCVDQDVDMELVEVLVRHGLWHRHGHKCAECPQPERGRGWVYIHDYLQHQSSREEVEQFRRKKSHAGKKGAAARWRKAPAKADAKAGAMADAYGKQHGKAMAEREVERELSSTSASSSLSVSSHRRSRTRAITDTELAQITALTGGGPAHARKTADFILSRIPEIPRDPLAYVLAAIRNDTDAYRYRRGNPHNASEWCPQPGHEAEWGDACRQCALDAKLAAAHNRDPQPWPDDDDWTPPEPEPEPDWTQDI